MTAPLSPSSKSSSPPLTPSLPPPVPVDTHPNRSTGPRNADPGQVAAKRNDIPSLNGYKAQPNRTGPTRSPSVGSEWADTSTQRSGKQRTTKDAAAAAASALRPAVASLRHPPAVPIVGRLERERKRRSASQKRRPATGWKKLLWIQQPCKTLTCKSDVTSLLRFWRRSRQLHRY